MAYSSFNSQFNRLGPPNDLSPTIWTYVTTDALTGVTSVQASGYFNAVANKLKPGDLIYVTSAASPWAAGLFVVKGNTRNLTAVPPVSGVVTLFNPTSVNTVIASH